MQSVFGLLGRFFYYLSGFCMLALCVVMLIEVVFRYIPGLTMAQAWVPGVLSLLDTWLIFLGSVVAMWKFSHLRIGFFADRLPSPFREWNHLVVNVVTLFLFIIILIYSRPIVATGWDLTFGGVPFSKGYSIIALPICIGIMSLYVILRILNSIKKIVSGSFDD
jgi:TRAP-type C4-dicarboxylate transport system permease small subunit